MAYQCQFGHVPHTAAGTFTYYTLFIATYVDRTSMLLFNLLLLKTLFIFKFISMHNQHGTDTKIKVELFRRVNTFTPTNTRCLFTFICAGIKSTNAISPAKTRLLPSVVPFETLGSRDHVACSVCYHTGLRSLTNKSKKLYIYVYMYQTQGFDFFQIKQYTVNILKCIYK